jgi:hypothetical protein
MRPREARRVGQADAVCQLDAGRKRRALASFTSSRGVSPNRHIVMRPVGGMTSASVPSGAPVQSRADE